MTFYFYYSTVLKGNGVIIFKGGHMPQKVSVYRRVVNVVVEGLSLDSSQKKEIKPSTKLVEDLGADSLDIMHVITCLGEKFGATPDDDKYIIFGKVMTIQTLVDAVNKVRADKLKELKKRRKGASRK